MNGTKWHKHMPTLLYHQQQISAASANIASGDSSGAAPMATAATTNAATFAQAPNKNIINMNGTKWQNTHATNANLPFPIPPKNSKVVSRLVVLLWHHHLAVLGRFLKARQHGKAEPEVVVEVKAPLHHLMRMCIYMSMNVLIESYRYAIKIIWIVLNSVVVLLQGRAFG